MLAYRTRRSRGGPLLAAMLAFLLLGPSLFAGSVTDVLPGDERESEIREGEIHSFLLPLVEGSRVTIRIEAESEDESTAPTLVLLDPTGLEIARDTSFRAEVRGTVGASGSYRVEIRAGSFRGEYEIEFDADLPSRVGDDTDITAGESAQVRVDAPVGSSVRIDVKRRSGSPPTVLSIRDGTGRELGFRIRRSTRKRVRLESIPVSAPGGLLVTVAPRDGGDGSYEVRGRLSDDEDEDPAEKGENEDRRLVLFLEPGADPEAVAAALGYELKEVRDGHIVVETGEDREGSEEDDARAARDLLPQVIGGEPDHIAQTPEGSQSNGIVLGSSIGQSAFAGQPAFEAIRAPAAHLRATGEDVVVAVLDTGIDAAHSLFAGRVDPGFDFVDGDADPAEEENFLDDDGDGEVDEGFGHGTFVAGLALGAAPGARILPVRVLDSDAQGSSSDIAAGIEFAVARGARIINLSLGTRQRSEVLRGAVRYALSHGVIVVAATGNGGSLLTVDFPSGVDGVIAVTALGPSNGRAPFANASRATTLGAPGVDLIGPYPGERWGTWSGTSFATALVSGGAALYVSRRPDAPPNLVPRAVSRSARRIPRSVPKSERSLLGRGSLDLSRLVR